jgi:hypothetical protein
MADVKHELLAHDDGIRIAAKGVIACNPIRTVIGPGWKVLAMLFESRVAGLTMLTAIHDTANANQIAFLKLADRAPNGGDATNDLVSWYARIDRPVGIDQAIPIPASGVQIGVADSAIEDLDADIVGTKIAALEGERSERGFLGVDCVTMRSCFHNDFFLLGLSGLEVRCHLADECSSFGGLR